MWPFNKQSKNEIRLTDEEKEAVDREWKMFMSAAPKEEGAGEWYAPKEVVDVLQRTMASQALLDLAKRYLMETEGSLADKANQSILFEKAAAAAVKAVAIDSDPLNLYKAGEIFEKVNKIEEARTFFRNFLALAPKLLKEKDENYKWVVQHAIDDIKSKNIL